MKERRGKNGQMCSSAFTAKKTQALERDNVEWAANRNWKQTKLLLFQTPPPPFLEKKAKTNKITFISAPVQYPLPPTPHQTDQTIIRSNSFRFFHSPPSLSFKLEFKRILQMIAIVFDFQRNPIQWKPKLSTELPFSSAATYNSNFSDWPFNGLNLIWTI